MNGKYSIAQLLLRFSIGIGFLLPVCDRLGFFGKPGDPNIIWGDWTNFIAYTHELMPYINVSTAYYFGLIATILELIFAVFLIVGYKIKYVAFGSFVLTLIFALSMLFFLHFRAPFNFSVFVVSFSCLILSAFPYYPVSIDDNLTQRRNF